LRIYKSLYVNILSTKKLLSADIFSWNRGKFSDELGNRLVAFKPVPQIPEKGSSV